MYRAFSLIETLTTIVVLTIAVYFISPIYFSLQEHNHIQNEITLLMIHGLLSLLAIY